MMKGTWTGQYDSFGTKIHEGDIIKSNGISLPVVYRVETASFLLQESENKFRTLCNWFGAERKVVSHLTKS